MHYPRIIDDALAAISITAIAGTVLWLNLDAKNQKKIEKARRDAMTQEERAQDDLENWANRIAW